MDVKSLESKVDALIEALDELERKNTMLESDRENWLVERNRLLEKNELAKSKVEAMILRLKALEQD
ncbi:MAG: TIGR02449 family protein [Gammaproteobacteria bacterium]|uniref:TIGR02449 family protein n=1 Tax=OM182 bacterium MED-G24 TaxID=1986255 RepID=A0A2A5X0J0_9GAMM|nr:TIGR02449 family protein [Gammaproteobacteria bacterium]PDH42201.1 MAG: TIGR02449 family protein [OM182 bacterium MED-G24]RPG23189.1 MAG: TIGR02449 family protein [Gammaproteobacteria bacterium TMED50]|tara:strand:+ start:241 stop:438 length:198 start_codon:yes stop_codon:yes gene_type:complete